jgi:hypothetical protein
MESKLLSSLGKIAGIGGIALGVFLLIFQGVLQKTFLPQLTSRLRVAAATDSVGNGLRHADPRVSNFSNLK